MSPIYQDKLLVLGKLQLAKKNVILTINIVGLFEHVVTCLLTDDCILIYEFHLINIVSISLFV